MGPGFRRGDTNSPPQRQRDQPESADDDAPFDESARSEAARVDRGNASSKFAK